MGTFTKTVRGGWQFTIEGSTFEAIRNIAGFAHRDWELWTVVDGRQDRCLEDQLASRAECVEEAGMRVFSQKAGEGLPIGAIAQAYERLRQERRSPCAPVGTIEFWQAEIRRLGGVTA